MCGETKLWKAVLTQQIIDAKSRSAKRTAKNNRILARQYLMHNDVDFKMVCDLADVNYRKLRTNLVKHLATEE